MSQIRPADQPSFDDVRDLYQNIILDRGRNPHYMHRMEPFDACAAGENPLCGDQVEVRVRFAPDTTVAEAAFEARGCAISMASADLMAEVVRGRDADGIRGLAADFSELARTGSTASADAAMQILQPLSGVSEYRSRVKCATLPWSALIAALDSAKEHAS
jgi:nitrogen fixation NifU-like protein